MWNVPLFPEQASTTARSVDELYFFVLGVIVFFSTLICVLIVYFAAKYRAGSRASRANPITEAPKLEAFYIGVPLALALFIFAWAAKVFFELYSPPGDAAEISVVGKQWMWYLQHPEGKREINELHLPVGRPVRLRMISQDVIHSFFVPAFRAKQDVLPGSYTSVWFRPTKVGRFHLFCAEYCGTRHSGMVGSVIVMDPADYEQWLASGSVTESMATAGARLFRQYGCSGCHSPNATVRAPLLDGVYGRPVPLEDGRVVTADDRYIRDSIVLPKSEVVAGYEPVMPTFEGQIKEDELLQIIAYIKALGRGGRAEP